MRQEGIIDVVQQYTQIAFGEQLQFAAHSLMRKPSKATPREPAASRREYTRVPQASKAVIGLIPSYSHAAKSY